MNLSVSSTWMETLVSFQHVSLSVPRERSRLCVTTLRWSLSRVSGQWSLGSREWTVDARAGAGVSRDTT